MAQRRGPVGSIPVGDNGGIVRGKAVHVDRLSDRMKSGVGLTLAMRARLAPPEPISVDPARLSAEERATAGAHPYPAGAAEALSAFEADAVLTRALGDLLSRSYLAVRRSEWQTYAAADEEFVHHTS